MVARTQLYITLSKTVTGLSYNSCFNDSCSHTVVKRFSNAAELLIAAKLQKDFPQTLAPDNYKVLILLTVFLHNL